jgi:CheY-like chemotaxis protein
VRRVDPRSVLLVVDTPTPSALFAEALGDEGYAVLRVTDGADAIRLLEDRVASDRICLVVLDMDLPRVDGAGVLRHLAEHGRPTPVIAVSGDVLQLGRAMRIGAYEVLAKPFELESFLHAVTRVCAATAPSEKRQQEVRVGDRDERPQDRYLTPTGRDGAQLPPALIERV